MTESLDILALDGEGFRSFGISMHMVASLLKNANEMEESTLRKLLYLPVAAANRLGEELSHNELIDIAKDVQVFADQMFKKLDKILTKILIEGHDENCTDCNQKH